MQLSDEFSIVFLSEAECLTVLGTSLALENASQHEVRHRIAAGWRSFWAMKSLLLNRRSSVKRRLKLFDSTVGSCVLWCAQSWTLRVQEIHLLRTARRSMLRRIVGAARAPDEDYVCWIKPVTRKAETLAKSAGVRDWIAAHSLLKWSWAGHVACRPAKTWVWQVSAWRDSEWQGLAMEVGPSRPMRPSRRRWMKWEDSLRRFFMMEGHGNWKVMTADREKWAGMAHAYMQSCCKSAAAVGAM